jgi:hypothetical protein
MFWERYELAKINLLHLQGSQYLATQNNFFFYKYVLNLKIYISPNVFNIGNKSTI